jgi:hypothetical protein
MKDLTMQYGAMNWCGGTILNVFDYSEDDPHDAPVLIVYVDQEGDSTCDWVPRHALPKRKNKVVVHCLVYKNGHTDVFTNEALAANVVQIAREGNVPRRHVIELELPVWEDVPK